MKLNIIGQFLGTSGYANHTRQLAAALSKICDVRIVTQIQQDAVKLLSDDELVNIKKPDSPDRINVMITMPHTWPSFCDKKFNVGFLVWEGDKIPRSWINNILDEKITQVWVPSQHTKHAIINTFAAMRAQDKLGTDDLLAVNKIRIVPHGVNLDLFKPIDKPAKFTFLCNKGYRHIYDRGGLQYAVQAFCEEFLPGECQLMIKINPAYINSPAFTTMMQKYAIGRTDIIVSGDSLPFETLPIMYNRAHVFLNPTRGEAFSMPCAEAMACGLPVITTNFGGQTDFVDNSNGWLVDYDLAEVKHEIMYEGVSWAVPKINELKRVMREAFNGKELAKQKGELSVSDIKRFTWQISAEKAIESLAEMR